MCNSTLLPQVKATYDLIAQQRPVKLNWKSEYKSKFESPVKDKMSQAAPSAYGRRNHPYKNTVNFVELNSHLMDIGRRASMQFCESWWATDGHRSDDCRLSSYMIKEGLLFFTK